METVAQAYEQVASTVTRNFSGDVVFCVALAIANAGAMTSWLMQWRGLIDAEGVTPAKDQVDNAVGREQRRNVGRYRARFAACKRLPSLLIWLGTTDASIQCLFGLGYLGIALLATGILPSLGALLCGAVYLSFLSVSQPWLGLQMDAKLVETNILFAATHCLSWAAPSAWVVAQTWLVFRIMVGCGAAKWSGGDQTWRDLTAMSFHYASQPLPNGLSRFMHSLPLPVHVLEGWMTYLCECAVPLAFLIPGSWGRYRVKVAAFVLTIGFNAAIGATGNYGHLHLLVCASAVASIIRLDVPCGQGTGSGFGAPVPLGVECIAWPSKTSPLFPVHVACWAIAWAITCFYIAVSCVPLANTMEGILELKVYPVRAWRWLHRAYSSLQQYRLVNYYSKFTHMTTRRWELCMEGSVDGGRTWHEIGYVAKPGHDLSATPRTLPPGYIPRLDWRMWFLPLAVQRALARGYTPVQVSAEAWYRRMEELVVAGNKDVWSLLRMPRQLACKGQLDGVRTLVYAYEFEPWQWDRDMAVTTTSGESAVAGKTAEEPGTTTASSVSAVPASVAASSSGSVDGSSSTRRRRQRRGQSPSERPPVPAAAAARTEGTGGPPGGPQSDDESGRSPQPPAASSSGAAAAAGWQVGKVWRRKYICEYDAVYRNAATARQAALAGHASASQVPASSAPSSPTAVGGRQGSGSGASLGAAATPSSSPAPQQLQAPYELDVDDEGSDDEQSESDGAPAEQAVPQVQKESLNS